MNGRLRRGWKGLAQLIEGSRPGPDPDVVSPRPKLRIWLIFRDRLFLFLSYFPRLPELPINSAKNQYTWQTAVGVAAICLLHGLATVVISVVFIYARPDLLGEVRIGGV